MFSPYRYACITFFGLLTVNCRPNNNQAKTVTTDEAIALPTGLRLPISTDESISLIGFANNLQAAWQRDFAVSTPESSALFRIQLLSVAANEDHPLRAMERNPLFFSSSFQDGKIGYHTDTFYDQDNQLLFHHMQCDHPGELSVRISLPQGEIIGHNRIQGTASADGTLPQALVIPFESAVSIEGSHLEVRGEGELLVVLCHNKESILTLWEKTCQKHDPEGKHHPDVSKITHALIDKAKSQNHSHSPY